MRCSVALMGRWGLLVAFLLVACSSGPDPVEVMEAEIEITGSCRVLEQVGDRIIDAYEAEEITADEATDLFWMISLRAYQIGDSIVADGLAGPEAEFCYSLSASVSGALIENS